MKLTVSLVLVGMMTTLPCQAEDANGNHAVWGLGQSSCHSYNKAREADEFTNYKVYLMGYLTAYNTWIPETYNISGTTDLNGIFSWIDAYCKKTALDSFGHALKQMVTEMHKTRLKIVPRDQTWGTPYQR